MKNLNFQLLHQALLNQAEVEPLDVSRVNPYLLQCFDQKTDAPILLKSIDFSAFTLDDLVPLLRLYEASSCRQGKVYSMARDVRSAPPTSIRSRTFC